MNKLLSRKLILSLVGVLIVVLDSLAIVNVSDENLWQIVTMILGYLGVEGAADVVRMWRQYTSTPKE